MCFNYNKDIGEDVCTKAVLYYFNLNLNSDVI